MSPQLRLRVCIVIKLTIDAPLSLLNCGLIQIAESMAV